MTSDQRNHLRTLIDQEKRRRLEAAKPKQSKEARRASYRAYYHRNREHILAQRRRAA